MLRETDTSRFQHRAECGSCGRIRGTNSFLCCPELRKERFNKLRKERFNKLRKERFNKLRQERFNVDRFNELRKE